MQRLIVIRAPITFYRLRLKTQPKNAKVQSLIVALCILGALLLKIETVHFNIEYAKIDHCLEACGNRPDSLFKTIKTPDFLNWSLSQLIPGTCVAYQTS